MRYLALAWCVALAVAGSQARADEWRLVWSDEFTGDRLDPARWSPVVDCWGGGNAERQCYTSSPRNLRVAQGLLTITARREAATGSALPGGGSGTSSGPNPQVHRDYTSARITTRGKASWLYGRIAVRARLPQGQGTWPAIWMLPEADSYGSWAASGEIDILEAVNLGTPCSACASGREDTILGTLHFGGPAPANVHKGTEDHAPQVLRGFHTYGIEWEPTRMRWLLDGKVWAERNRDEWHTTASDVPGAPFDRPFRLILNLAIGGKLAESRGRGGVDPRGYPKRFAVDWVRVWQYAGQTASAAVNAGRTGRKDP